MKTIKIIILSTIAIGVCSHLKSTKSSGVVVLKQDGIINDQFGDFDRAYVPNKPVVLARMIKTLKPTMGQAQKNDLSLKIHQVFSKHDIAPQIVLSIIDTESSFNQAAISSTGDVSMAQVNVEVWNKEYARLNRTLIDKERLKRDEVYALETMAEILVMLKHKYEKTDRRWYGRYHSKTRKHKEVYLAKLEERMKKMEKADVLAFPKTIKPRLLAMQ